MHPEAVLADTTRGHEVRAQRVVLRQVCREVHLLPLEGLLDVLTAREAKLTKMPALDEVNLAVLGILVDLVWVATITKFDLLREQTGVQAVMTDEKCIFFTSQPPFLRWKLHDAIPFHRIYKFV